MLCPDCGLEMAEGRTCLTLMGGDARDILPLMNWFPESEFHQTGFKSIFKRNGKTLLADSVREAKAWYCPKCSRVLASFEAKP